MNRLSDLMYQQPEPEYDPYEERKRVVQAMLLAQNSIPAGMQRQFIENDPDLYGPARPAAPAPPQGGGYKTGSDYVFKPKTEAEIEAWRAKIREEAKKKSVR